MDLGGHVGGVESWMSVTTRSAAILSKRVARLVRNATCVASMLNRVEKVASRYQRRT